MIHWQYGTNAEGVRIHLGPPTGEQLHFCETIGFGFELLFDSMGATGRKLTKVLLDFEDRRPIPLKDKKTIALVNALRLICEHVASDREFNRLQYEAIMRKYAELCIICDGREPK